MPDISVRLLINAFSVLGALFALWKGGRTERVAAIVVIVNVAIGQSGKHFAPSADSVIRLINDGVTALVLLGVTVRYAALWTGGVMLFYAAQFAMHSYYLVTEQPTGDYFYALINNINFSGVIWCLIIGTAVSWRRRAKAEGAVSARANPPESTRP